MKLFIRIFFILTLAFLQSCKSGAEKYEINDVEAHRAYQDTLLNEVKLEGDYKNVFRKLLSEYLKIESNEAIPNPNAYYYLARLYNKVYSYPIYATVVDTASGDIKDSFTYANYKDSARIYSQKALDIDENAIKPFYLLSNSIYWEWITFINSKYKAPFIGKSNKSEFDKLYFYLTQNALKFRQIDTSSNKRISQEIIEFAYFFISAGTYNFDFDNISLTKNNIDGLLLIEQYCSVLDELNEFYILDRKSYLKNKQQRNTAIKLAKLELEHIKLQEQIDGNMVTKNFLNQKLIIMDGPDDRYVIFKDNGTAEISIKTCEAGGVFGGGTYVTNQTIYGTYSLEGDQNVNVTLPNEFYFECNNGYKERWTKVLKFIYNDLNSAHPGVALFSGVKWYVIPTASGRWREWRDYHMNYYLNPYFY